MPLHMIKLCVGAATVADLLEWRRSHARPGEPWILRTRQTPKRAAEMVDGGSVYRVFRGVVLARQAIWDINTVGEGAAARCEVTLDPQVVLTAPMPRRAFQGWRYLTAADAPPDLANAIDGEVPPELAVKLREAGAW
jgi:hypothetical protein